jgi:uncharacterized membrane protein
MKNFLDYLKNNKGAVVGGLIGLFFGILLLSIGFWPVLLLVVLCVIGAVIGSMPGVQRAVVSFFQKLMRGKEE